MPIATGTRLGQYEVQEFIGQGAMGLVYRAYHAQLERTGAVKVMQAIAPDADTVARFRHEAQAIAQMRHPNIVNIYDFGEYEGTPFMIAEYVPGGSLAGKMSRERLEPATALRYLEGIAAGLDYAHRHGVVHRDVKPANVLLTAEDSPVLADFGLAKLLHGSSLKSMTGVTTGTPAYMAPEQVTGSKVGPAADRYSLATIAYEMLTGVIPFDGEALMELLYAQVHRPPPSPSSRNPALGRRVDEVILRGLAKDPAARWESCSAFVDALGTALGAFPGLRPVQAGVAAQPLASTVPLASAAVAERAPDRQPVPATVVVERPAPTGPPARPTRRRRLGLRLLLAVGLIIALLIVLAAVRAATAPPATLSLSSSTVAAGDSVVVSASNVPANQVGEIQLWSVVHTFSFRADAKGQVKTTVTVPRDIGAGDHQVKICWSGSCHAEATLHVLVRVAQVTPTPGAWPVASPSPATTPTGTPAECGAPILFVPSISKTKGFSATFKCFPAGGWAVSVVQSSKPYGAGAASVPSGTVYYTRQFTTPSSVQVSQPAHVIACNTAGRCYASTDVSVAA